MSSPRLACAIVLLLSFLPASAYSQSVQLQPEETASEGAACFPECREGFLCSPAGECVSECNPECAGEEICVKGKCYVESKGASSPPPASSTSTESKESEDAFASNKVVFEAVVGLILQFWDYSSYDATSNTGIETGLTIYPSEAPYFIRPRVSVLFGEDPYYETFVDLGYEFRFESGRFRGGVQTNLTFGLWPDVVGEPSNDAEPIGPYAGVGVSPFIRNRNFRFAITLEYGLQLATEPDAKVTTLGLGMGYAF